jgi:4-oxalocrotonate tautomerase
VTATRSTSNPLRTLKEKIMPHVIVKLWPGKSKQQKVRLAEAITKDVTSILDYGDESVSVAIEEVEPRDWAEKVFKPDIVNNPEKLYKKPGYDLSELP